MKPEDRPTKAQFVEGVAVMNLRVCSASGCRTRENMPVGGHGLCSIHQRNAANDAKKAKEAEAGGEGDEARAGNDRGGDAGDGRRSKQPSEYPEQGIGQNGPVDIPRRSVIVDSNGRVGDITWRPDTQCSHQLTKDLFKLSGNKDRATFCSECGIQMREYNRVKPYPKKGRKK